MNTKSIFKSIIVSYLGMLTKNFIKKNNIQIIGITGSYGKSTLTLLTRGVISQSEKVESSFKNGKGFNSETGVPFAFLQINPKNYHLQDWLKYIFQATINFFIIKPDYSKFILEMGVDKANDMDILLKMVSPQIRTFLSIGNVHQANFTKSFYKKGENPLFKEKSKLITSAESNQIVILNHDVQDIYNLKNATKAQVITFGYHKNADIKIGQPVFKDFQTVVDFIYLDKKYRLELKNKFVGKDLLRTYAAAFAIGVASKIDPSKIIKILSLSVFPPGRASLFKGVKQSIIIDSSYNSSPKSLKAQLKTLLQFQNHQKVLVLGDMRELGILAEKKHRELADLIIKIKPRLVFLIGPLMKKYLYPELKKLDYFAKKTFAYDFAGQAVADIANNLQKNDLVLVKGSQNTIFLEIIVEHLLADKKDISKLCRRGEFWDKARKSFI